jgi:hypothetical protein
MYNSLNKKRVVSGDPAHRRDSINEIIRFMEEQANAEMTSMEIIEG